MKHVFPLLLFACIAAAGTTVELESGIKADKLKDIQKIPGRFGYALDFYHDPQILNGKEHPISTAGWGVDVWFRLADPSGKSVLLGSNRWQNFQLAIHNGQIIRLAYHNGKNRSDFMVPYEFTPGKWYQLAVTQNKEGIIDFYVNGKLIMSRDAEKKFPAQSAHIAVIGSYHINSKGSFDHVFKGYIDRPRLHDFHLTSDFVRQDWEQGNQTLPLIPMPQQVHMANGEKDWKRPSALQIAPLPPTYSNRNYAYKKLAESLKSKKIPIVKNSAAKLVLAAPDSKDIPAKLQEYTSNGKFPEEGYLLSMRPDKILLVAATSRGFHHGLLTLNDLFERETLPSADIFDWPEFPLRAAMVVVDNEPPIVLTDRLKNIIDTFSEQRIKYLMIRAHDWAMPDRQDVQKSLKKVVDYAKSREMVVLPYLQTYSHAKGFLFHHPEFGHTQTVSDEKITLQAGQPVELSKKNVVITEDIPLIVRNASGEQMTENRDYKVSLDRIKTSWKFPPESKRRYTWALPYYDPNSGACRLELLPEGRLKPGETVNVTYDVSAAGECSCPFLKEYNQWLDKCIDSALKLTGSDYINMGLDEIWIPRGKGRCCAAHPLTSEQTMGYAFSKAAEMTARHPGVKMMAFSDMIDPRQTPSWKSTEVTRDFDKYFDHRIYMMPWYYGDHILSSASIGQSVRYFLDHNYPLIGTAGKVPLNQLLWGEALLPLRDRYPIDGFFYTMWDDQNTKQPFNAGLTAYSQMSWTPNRLYLPKMNRLRALLKSAGIPQDATGETLKKFAENNPDWLQEVRALLPEAEQELAAFGQSFKLDSLPINQIGELPNAFKQSQELTR